MTVEVVHRLISGDRIEVAHGSESLVVSVWYGHDPSIVSAGHLTPAEALDLAEDLRRQAEAVLGSMPPTGDDRPVYGPGIEHPDFTTPGESADHWRWRQGLAPRATAGSATPTEGA